MAKGLDIQKIIRDNVGDLDVSENAMPVIAMMAHGASITATARALGISASIVTRITEEKGFASLLSAVRDNIDTWHRSQLSTAGVLAWKKIMEFLSADIKMSDPMYKEQIKLADSIARKVTDQKVFLDNDDTDEPTDIQLQLHSSSVDLIAQKVSDLQSKKKPDGLSVKDLKKTRLDSLPAVVKCHPKTKYGSVDYGENGMRLCHICGGEQELFFAHIEGKHNMTLEKYAKTFGIDEELLLDKRI